MTVYDIMCEIWDSWVSVYVLFFMFFVTTSATLTILVLLLFMLDIVWVRMWMWADDSVSEWVLLVQVCFIGILVKDKYFIGMY